MVREHDNWRDTTQGQRFLAFHELNPDVFEMYEQFAWELKNRGFPRHSSDFIIQRIRWEIDLASNDPNRPTSIERRRAKRLKINSSYSPYYSRLLMEKESAFSGFFEIRELRENKGRDSDEPVKQH